MERKTNDVPKVQQATEERERAIVLIQRLSVYTIVYQGPDTSSGRRASMTAL